MSVMEKIEEPAIQGGLANGLKIHSRAVSVYYGDKQALKEVDLDIGANEVTALIGPSGCGKSTYLRCLNRMNETIEGCTVTGKIEKSEAIDNLLAIRDAADGLMVARGDLGIEMPPQELPLLQKRIIAA